MSDRSEWAELFLSANGRLSRTPFLIAAAVLIGFATFYEALANYTLHWLTGWFVYPILLFSGACLLSKRLHDRGRSGWWSLLILVAVVAVWPQPEHFLDFLFSLVLIWAIVELGVMGGEQGANRYGANPMKVVSV
ncbi:MULTISPECIES: DUF805 domain-containing protein [unclassified Caulobacter]|jgi:uncharacterized membrane protein YhaH (DUF805 family)|uniref:DUF805 domain-containing protein n=1 Tax=unclassified Caulobacter TaxID=2648921 RepID=UPI0006FBA97E|nr:MULTISPECIES: DUF805 domain-containing protein [unclassified Caulobacter]KQV56670.1 hypothetical protein ASC62_10125 [Caulobacter sp. Root342]KQV72307.1 hypothetical protein ASC70_01075 [Caulobacter sp. Root343]